MPAFDKPSSVAGRSKHPPVDWEKFSRAVANMNNPEHQATGLKYAEGVGVPEEARERAEAQMERSGEVLLELEKVLQLQNKVQTLTWEEMCTIVFHMSCMLMYTATEVGQLERLVQILMFQNEVSMIAAVALDSGKDITKPDDWRWTPRKR